MTGGGRKATRGTRGGEGSRDRGAEKDWGEEWRGAEANGLGGRRRRKRGRVGFIFGLETSWF